MPPLEAARPKEEEYAEAYDELTAVLDHLAIADPNPGRTATFRRLTRTEYENAVRDLLAIEIDAGEFLPEDSISAGFDNITVGDLSPTRLDRYLTAAQRISRLAVGGAGDAQIKTIRIPADITQEQHVEGLPFGTRGGALLRQMFPRTGEYEIEVRLARDRNEHVEGLHERHTLEILLDREIAASFEIAPPDNSDDHYPGRQASSRPIAHPRRRARSGRDVRRQGSVAAGNAAAAVSIALQHAPPSPSVAGGGFK